MAVAQDVPGGGIHGARAALAAGKSALVWRRQIADTDTPISAALKLFEPDRGDFLLESVEGGVVRGRYSLIGLAPDLVFRAQGEKAEINRHWATDRDAFVAEPVGALDALRALVAECRADLDPALPAALACLVGYFGYETVGLVEKLPRPSPNPVRPAHGHPGVRPAGGRAVFGRTGVEGQLPRRRCRD